MFRGFLIKKTTFSYFPGVFENPAQTKYYLKKTKSTDKSKINSDQESLFFAVSLYPISFFANTPIKAYKNYGIDSWTYSFTSIILKRT